MSAPDAPLLAITGAAGFLGAATVAAARARGLRVRALVRRSGARPWDGDAGVETITLDLAAVDARAGLDAALAGAAAVVHCAGRLSGSDAEHARDTVGPTETLIAALAAMPAPRPRLVLAGSFSVYGYAALPEGATLDETVPLEPDPHLRDPYARAKLAQERLAMRAAQRDGVLVRVLRAGAIVGPGRAGDARLGFALGPVLFRVGGAIRVPAVAVGDVAAALVAAAVAAPGRSDLPILQGEGRFEAIDVVASEAPTQAQVIAALARAGRGRRVLPLSLKLLRLAATAASLAGALVPPLARLTPAPLRREAFDARFKPLRYSAARLEDRLGLAPGDPLAAIESREDAR